MLWQLQSLANNVWQRLLTVRWHCHSQAPAEGARRWLGTKSSCAVISVLLMSHSSLLSLQQWPAASLMTRLGLGETCTWPALAGLPPPPHTHTSPSSSASRPPHTTSLCSPQKSSPLSNIPSCVFRESFPTAPCATVSDWKKEVKWRRGDTWLEEGLRDKYSDKQYKPNIENTKRYQGTN